MGKKEWGGVESAVTCHSGSLVRLVVAYTRACLISGTSEEPLFLRKSFLTTFFDPLRYLITRDLLIAASNVFLHCCSS